MYEFCSLCLFDRLLRGTVVFFLLFFFPNKCSCRPPPNPFVFFRTQDVQIYGVRKCWRRFGTHAIHLSLFQCAFDRWAWFLLRVCWSLSICFSEPFQAKSIFVRNTSVSANAKRGRGCLILGQKSASYTRDGTVIHWLTFPILKDCTNVFFKWNEKANRVKSCAHAWTPMRLCETKKTKSNFKEKIKTRLSGCSLLNTRKHNFVRPQHHSGRNSRFTEQFAFCRCYVIAMDRPTYEVGGTCWSWKQIFDRTFLDDLEIKATRQKIALWTAKQIFSVNSVVSSCCWFQLQRAPPPAAPPHHRITPSPVVCMYSTMKRTYCASAPIATAVLWHSQPSGSCFSSLLKRPREPGGKTWPCLEFYPLSTENLFCEMNSGFEIFFIVESSKPAFGWGWSHNSSLTPFHRMLFFGIKCQAQKGTAALQKNAGQHHEHHDFSQFNHSYMCKTLLRNTSLNIKDWSRAQYFLWSWNEVSYSLVKPKRVVVRHNWHIIGSPLGMGGFFEPQHPRSHCQDSIASSQSSRKNCLYPSIPHRAAAVEVSTLRQTTIETPKSKRVEKRKLLLVKTCFAT